jgi:dTDP-4-amino-4,6-dideoxygalactose transaminase
MNTLPKKQIPLLDLRAQYATIHEEVERAVAAVMESQKFILGEDVGLLEREIADYCGTKHAVACAAGSDAVLLALAAAGVGPGDEVLTVPYTFFATAGYIVHAGAKPVFTDVEPATFNMDVDQARCMLERHPGTRAMVAVHLFGGCAKMEPILEMAAARGILVIEDAAQAIGAEYNGRRAGSMGAAGCFSFFPSKNLGAFGDGGIVTTNDDAMAERLRALRVHGSTRKYYHEYVGYNSRLDTLQAAILRVKLRHLDEWSEARGRNGRLYRELFAASGAPVLTPEPGAHQTRHIWNQFVIRCARRDELRRYLAEHGAGTEVYYPVPLHLQPCFAGLGYRSGDFPVSEQLAGETLALPVYPELAREDIEQVVALITEFYRAHQ